MRVQPTATFPLSGLTEREWRREVRVELVDTRTVVITQDVADLVLLMSGVVPAGHEHLPHLVEHDGALHVEDGLPQTVRAGLRGDRQLAARVYRRPASG
jgi:hypothetical protein